MAAIYWAATPASNSILARLAVQAGRVAKTGSFISSSRMSCDSMSGRNKQQYFLAEVKKMIKRMLRSSAKLPVFLFLIASSILLASDTALASEGPKERGNVNEVIEPASAPEDECVVVARPGTLNIHYVLYNSIKPQPEPQNAALDDQAKAVFSKVASFSSSRPIVFPTSPAPAPAPRVSFAPMTAGEKFMYFATASFKPPGPYALSIFQGLFNEALDNNEKKKDTFDDYLADSMTRAARSMGNRTANNFFEKFLYASIFRQDPRYHRSGKTGVGARIGYAISRLFVTYGDRGGSQPNVSYLLGGLTGAFATIEIQREEKQNTKDTFSRWGNHLAITALSHILREFLSGQ